MQIKLPCNNHLTAQELMDSSTTITWMIDRRHLLNNKQYRNMILLVDGKGISNKKTLRLKKKGGGDIFRKILKRYVMNAHQSPIAKLKLHLIKWIRITMMTLISLLRWNIKDITNENDFFERWERTGEAKILNFI